MEKKIKVQVIDSVCGSGKTTYAIDLMNQLADNNDRFIFVTPYLDEIDRVIDACSKTGIQQPDDEESLSKTASLIDLLEAGCNIATTHALFTSNGNTIKELIEKHNYFLILDEVITVIKTIPLLAGDKADLLELNQIQLDNGKVTVTEQGLQKVNNKTEIKALKEMVDRNVVYLQDDKDTYFYWEFSIDILKVFQSVTILTYMFRHQTMYNFLKVNNTEFFFYNLKDYRADKTVYCGKVQYTGNQFKDMIDIYEGKLNKIGIAEKNGIPFSATWYDKIHKQPRLRHLKKELKDNCYNYIRNITKAKSEDILFTVYNDYKKSIVGDGFRKNDCFAPVNVRATNTYRHKTVCMYLACRFEEPFMQRYFQQHKINVKNDYFALSEFIQWLFRTAIRDGKRISLYLPSAKLRKLLKDWLNGDFDNDELITCIDRKIINELNLNPPAEADIQF